MSPNPDAVVGQYIEPLNQIFATVRDKRTAHLQSRDLMARMAADQTFVTAVLARHLRKKGALNSKNYPVVACNVALTPYFGLEMNCWIPLPDGATNIATKAIHHHGDMLLTTATAFGPGYEHWTFHKPELLDAANELFLLRPLHRGAHPLHHVDFVDSYIAHLPLFPASLTITLALWSSRFPTTWKDRVKRLGIFRGREGTLRKLLSWIGLAKTLELKVVEYFDFYPTDDGFKGIKERVEFPRGPNEDYLRSLFHVLQETGNASLAPLIEEAVSCEPHLENPALLGELRRQLSDGTPIAGKLSAGHYGVPYANFTAAQIENALGAQDAKAKQTAHGNGPGVAALPLSATGVPAS